MRILDRYVLKEYIVTFLIIIVSFSLLFIMIDVFDNMSRVLKYNAPLKTVILYFAARFPYNFTLAAPVAGLLAGLFLMNALSKHHESVAMRAAGISIFRMTVPLHIFGIFFSIFMIFFGEYVVPKAEDYHTYVNKVVFKGQKREDLKMRSNIHYRGGNNVLYTIGFFDGYREIMRDVDILTYEPKTGQVISKVMANEAVWTNKNWMFRECTVRHFFDGKLTSSRYYNETVVPEVDVTPKDFIRSARKPLEMNFWDLAFYIKSLKKIGESFNRELVDLNLKIAFPLTNFIILLFCVPLASISTRSKGRGMVFVVGLSICFLFLSVQRLFMSLGYNGVLPPLVAAWLPNTIFFLTGVGFVIRAEV